MSVKQHPDDLEAVRTVIDALTGFETRDQERILRWAREKLGLSPDVGGHPAATPRTPATAVHELEQPAKPTRDIKSFIESKKPASDSQFAAAVAYFYRFEAPEHLRKDSITKGDLQEACRQVNRSRFPRPDQTLVNAHAQGLLDRGEPGAYSINTVGENLVAVALPSDGSRPPGARKANRRKVIKTGSSRPQPNSKSARRSAKAPAKTTRG